MPRIRYAVAMSLDGYIAGPKGDADWIIMDPDIDFGALFAQFDTFLMGRRTFEGMERAGTPGLTGGKTFIFSRTLRPQDHPAVTIVRDVSAASMAPPAHGAKLTLTSHGVYQTGIVSLEYAVTKLTA